MKNRAQADPSKPIKGEYRVLNLCRKRDHANCPAVLLHKKGRERAVYAITVCKCRCHIPKPSDYKVLKPAYGGSPEYERAWARRYFKLIAPPAWPVYE